MDILSAIGHFSIAAIILLGKCALYAIPFVLLYIVTSVGPAIDSGFKLELLAGILFGIALFFLDTRDTGTFFGLFKKGGPWEMSFWKFWAERANPFKYPLGKVISWIMADPKHNRLVLFLVCPAIALLGTIIKLFKLEFLAAPLGILVFLISTVVACYAINLICYTLHQHWAIGLAIGVICSIGTGGTVHHVYSGDTLVFHGRG